MVNDFEWTVEISHPPLYEGAKFIVDINSIIVDDDHGNPFKAGEHIIFEIDSFGIGCIDSPLSGNNIGKEVANFTILKNTQIGSGYVVGYMGEIQIERVHELIEEGYWQSYEEEV